MTVRYFIHNKDADVEWLGQVPEHWELKRLKYLATYLDGVSIRIGGEQHYWQRTTLSITLTEIFQRRIDFIWCKRKKRLQWRGLMRGNCVREA